MPHTVLPDIPTGELKERLSRVRYVFTDLDGTMLAPGSCALADAEGNPCIDFVATLLELKRAGIEVIPCSGRNRSMLHEDTRLLGLNSYIGEMGGLLMLDRSDNRWEYFTADMPFNPIWGYSPHECIEATGILDEFQNRWPGLLEYHNDMSTGYKHREVTVGMRGEIPDEDARDIIRRSGAELDWGDNGYLNYISAPTTLKLPEGVKGRASASCAVSICPRPWLSATRPRTFSWQTTAIRSSSSRTASRTRRPKSSWRRTTTRS